MTKLRRLYFPETLLLVVLWTAAVAEARAQQQCPELKVFCPRNVTTTQTRCSALVSGNANPNLSYEWNVSLPVPMQKFLGQENEVGIDLSQFPGYALTVTVKVSGLPEGCPNTAAFEVNAEAAPEPRSVSDPPESSLSPAVTLNCPETVDEGTPIYFNATIAEAEPNVTPVYQWSISSGRITNGQGTRTITVDTTDQGRQIIRATLKVLGTGASRAVTCATQIREMPKAYKLAEYKNLDWKDEEIRLRRFFLRLKTGLDERAYIIAYGGRNGPKEEAGMLAGRARDYLVESCGVDGGRVNVLLGGEREAATVELWVVATGGLPPVPNPTAEERGQTPFKKRPKTSNRKEKSAKRSPRLD